jgi:hypothetical protein
MTARDRRRGALRWALLAMLVAGALAGMAACGPVTAGPSGSPSTGTRGATATSTPATAASSTVPASAAPLCQNVTHLNTLVVSLAGGLARSELPVALPAGITFRDPARVQAVAAALCALPAAGPVPAGCPADFGGSYRLVFTAGQQAYPPVVIKATGCRTVSGLGPVRTTSAAFWALLAKKLGTRH